MLRIEWVDGQKLLRDSFRNVKKDVSDLKMQLVMVEEELRRLQELAKDIRTRPEEPREIPKISESQPSLSLSDLRLELRKIVQEEVGKALKDLNTKAGEVFSAETEPENHRETPPQPAIQQKAQRKQEKDHLREELMKSYERNRKDIIKQQILGEASKGSLTKIALRDVVVDQKKYCSKASFYRYMDELELQGLITYQRKKGKDVIEPMLQPPIDL